MYRARIKTRYNEFYLEEESIKDLLEIFDQPYIESIYSRAGEDKAIYDYLQELKGSDK